MSTPERIGVRELRQNASVYLRGVREGRTYEVTSDGEPVALLVPVPRDRYDRMVADGSLTPPAAPGSWRMGDLLPPVKDGPTPAQILEEMRADER